MIKTITGNTWVAFLILSTTILIIYSQTLSFDILYNFDDDAYMYDPSITQINGAHIKKQCSDYYLGMYQPLPVMSFSALLHFFPGSVHAQRLINILLHVLNTLLVLILIKRLTANQSVAFFTAFLFAVHPMHVESVSWMSTRSNLMYSAFFLLSLISYLQWIETRKISHWIFMFVFFLLSLFCKVTAATFPLLLPLIHWYKGKKFDKLTLFLYFPLIFLSCIFILIGIQASGAFGHISELGHQYSLPDRGLIFFNALGLYLYKAFIPTDLSAIYLYPWKPENSLLFSFVVCSILAMIVSGFIFFSGWKLRNKESGKDILFGFLFFLLTIIIVMPLKWSRTVLIAERYTYIPYIGLMAGILLLVFRYADPKRPWVKNSLFVLLLGILVLFSYQSYNRNKVWKSPITLFTDVIKKNRSGAEVSMGYFNRGNEYYRLKEMNNALSDYNTSIDLFPSYPDAYFNRGLIFYESGENSLAIRDFTAAIKYKPSLLKAYLNRGTVYRSMGDYDKALSDFTHIISVKPDGAAYFSRGALYYFNFGNDIQACDDWKLALNLGFEPARKALEKFCH